MSFPDHLIRVASLTPPGRGALAVVGIAGSGAVALADALFRPRSGRPLAGRSDAAICVGRWPSSSVGEDVVVVRHGARELEVHCHGGLAAAAAILQSLVDRGAVAVSWADFEAALDVDEIALEVRRALPLVAGPKAARILVRQLSGGLRGEIGQLVALSAAAAGSGIASRIGGLLRAARVGLRLTVPWRVVFAGRVNAGKSSLINALAGHGRMLVSPHPGTTRDLVETRVVLGGWEVDLIDTAGTRDAATEAAPVEQAGIDRGRTAAGAADLVVDVAAADDPVPLHPDGRTGGPPRLRVLAKTDLLGAPPSPGAAAPVSAADDAVWTSASTGAGIDSLAARITGLLVPEETTEPGLLEGPVPFTPRQVELLRRLSSPGPPTGPEPAA